MDAQFNLTEFGWSRTHPMKKKRYAHETLSLFFKRDGVTLNMVVYGSKYQNPGSFRKKYQEADCHIKQTETYSPW